MSEVTNTVQILNSNIIQIKRGAKKPDGKLAPYELGFSTDDNTLYIGGSLVSGEEPDTYVYGAAQSIRVEYANQANLAKKIVDNESKVLNIGNSDKPVYFSNGVPVVCQSFIPVTGGAFTGRVTIPSLVGTENELWGSSFPTTNLVDGRIFFKIN